MDSSLDRSSYILNYRSSGKRWIQRFKIHASPEWIPLWKSWIREYFVEANDSLHLVDAIVPIPPHRRPLIPGWSASQEFARLISEMCGKPVVSLLKQTRRVQKQSDLSRPERVSNVSGAFTLSRQLKPSEKSFLLVDDVITTGTTLRECARLLKQHGASHVQSFAGARAPLKSSLEAAR